MSAKVHFKAFNNANGCNIDVVFAGINTTLMLLKLSLISSGWHPDKFAVAVKLEGRAVGHLPFSVAPTVLHFLNRSINRLWKLYWKAN